MKIQYICLMSKLKCNLFIIYSPYPGLGESWSQSSSGERRGTPHAGHSLSQGEHGDKQAFTLTYTPVGVASCLSLGSGKKPKRNQGRHKAMKTVKKSWGCGMDNIFYLALHQIRALFLQLVLNKTLKALCRCVFQW